MKELVSINGIISSPEDAKISVFDRGFLFGDAIYEVTRSYNRIFFKIEDHIERLYNSANLMRMKLPMSQEQLIEHIYKLYKGLDVDDLYMRIQISRGTGAIGLSPRLVSSVNEVIYMYPFTPISSELYKEGVTIFVTDRTRNTKRSLDPNIKSGNYLNNILALIEGEEHGAFETFMVNVNGHITEGTTSNLFLVKDGVLRTAPESYDLLRGITRKIVLSLAQNLGISTDETGFSLKELQEADEIFLTSSTREIVPVSHVNGISKEASNFILTQKLMGAYKEHIGEYCDQARSRHPWK